MDPLSVHLSICPSARVSICPAVQVSLLHRAELLDPISFPDTWLFVCLFLAFFFTFSSCPCRFPTWVWRGASSLAVMVPQPELPWKPFSSCLSRLWCLFLQSTCSDAPVLFTLQFPQTAPICAPPPSPAAGGRLAPVSALCSALMIRCHYHRRMGLWAALAFLSCSPLSSPNCHPYSVLLFFRFLISLWAPHRGSICWRDAVCFSPSSRKAWTSLNLWFTNRVGFIQETEVLSKRVHHRVLPISLKIRDTKGTFLAKMGTINDKMARTCMCWDFPKSSQLISPRLSSLWWEEIIRPQMAKKRGIKAPLRLPPWVMFWGPSEDASASARASVGLPLY